MQTIYLDISNKGVIPCIQAKQSEVGRKFLAVITDSGVPYEIKNDSVVSVWYEGASGEGNYTDIGNKPAISVSKNRLTVELIEQMLSVSGDGVITILINSQTGEQIGLWNIDYFVEPVAGIESEKAEEYYTAFSNAASSLAQSAETIKQKQDRIDSIIKAKNATAAGVIYPFASSNIPSGFLLCDGSEYSRTEYAELFEAIGTTYGSGDGKTTFNVPNLSTRVPVGKGDGFDLGSTGGESEHLLLESEMPSHTHEPSTLATPDPAYPKYGFQLITPLSSSFTARARLSSGEDYYASVSNANQDVNNLSYSLQTAATGGNEPHNIMQPYTVVNYIISTGKEIEFVVGGKVGGSGSAEGAVLYTEQTLTPEQQAQARANIGAADANVIGNIETTLDSIIEIQNNLIGGDDV